MKRVRRDHLARLVVVREAITAIRAHVVRGELDDPLVFDAVRMRLVEIGEAVGALPDELLSTEPCIPWREIVAMRYKLAHPCYDSALGIVAATVADDLPVIEAAIGRMQSRMGDAT